MRQFCRTALGIWIAAAVLSPCYAQRPQELTNDSSLLGFLDQLAEATYQFNIGNAEPYLALLSPSGDLTLMGAAGGMEKGIAAIRPRLEFLTQRRTEGKRFEENRAEIEYVSISASGDLAYTVQFERRRLSVPGQEQPAKSVLRATHVLRKENGEWKLLHRHADPLVEVTIPGLPAPKR
jgi:ketosteroid isomerase-like protein